MRLLVLASKSYIANFDKFININSYTKEKIYCNYTSSKDEFILALETNIYDIALYDTTLIPSYETSVFELIDTKKDTYLLALINKNDNFSTATALQIGVDDYIYNNLTYSACISKIAAISRVISSRGSKQELYYNNITLNIENRKLINTKNNLSVKLSDKEFEVFFKLITKPDKIVKIEELSKTCRHLVVYIKLLRKKVEKIGIEPYIIRSHRGFGYSISFNL